MNTNIHYSGRGRDWSGVIGFVSNECGLVVKGIGSVFVYLADYVVVSDCMALCR